MKQKKAKMTLRLFLFRGDTDGCCLKSAQVLYGLEDYVEQFGNIVLLDA